MIRFPVTGFGPAHFPSSLVNALSLGCDLSAVPRSRLLWEPDLSVFQEGMPIAPANGTGFEAAQDLAQLGQGLGARKGVLPSVLEASSRIPQMPSDRNLISKETEHWVRRNERPNEDIQVIEILVRRIRWELWRTLHEEPDSEIARAIVRKETLTVRITPPTAAGLEDYELKLFRAHMPQTAFLQVQWSLDLKTGALVPIEFSGHAVAELQALSRQIQNLRGFVFFYRRTRLEFLTLKAEPLLIGYPARSPRPSPPPKAAERLEETKEPSPEPQESVLVRHYPQIQEGVLRDVEDFIQQNHLPEPAARRLRVLIQKVLSSLYTRELRDPRVDEFAYLFFRVRTVGELFDIGDVELLTPPEYNPSRYDSADICLTLKRHPRVDRDFRSNEPGGQVVLEQMYLESRLDSRGRPINEELQFQRELGFGAKKFRIPLKDLHLSPPNISK